MKTLILRGCEAIQPVIARSDSDEAIHLSACRTMDCFASLAMTGMECRAQIRQGLTLNND
jgi:hypothetical protein